MLRHLRVVLVAVMVLTLCACPAPRRPPPPIAVPVPELVPVAGARLYEVAPGESLVRILVYRGGALASAGHNHVIASHALSGRIYLHRELAWSAFELSLPVRTLTMDEASLRSEEGADFSSVVSPAAMAGTRGNMLGASALDAERHPFIRIVSTGIRGDDEDIEVDLRVGLKGAWYSLTVPVVLRREAQRLTATGQFALRHADVGLEPFSALLGALKVQDQMMVKFAIVANFRAVSR